ncbi:MAG: hypothetical protein M1594_00440, partial [Candidatus Marsarchaeota archaeon]|nr:hypothetical protein [Candidatus Marsarchaeota archaeon]
MERNESEKQLVSTLGQVVRWRKSNNQGIIEKNVKALHLIGEIVQSTPDTKAKAEGIKQLRLISKNHSEEMIKGEAESVLRGVKEFKAKSNIERLSLLKARIKS